MSPRRHAFGAAATAESLPLQVDVRAVAPARVVRHFPEIESLRGLAILLVFLHHANSFLTTDRVQAPGRFHGWTGESVVLVATILVASLALSTITYRCIEQPFLRRKT